MQSCIVCKTKKALFPFISTVSARFSLKQYLVLVHYVRYNMSRTALCNTLLVTIASLKTSPFCKRDLTIVITNTPGTSRTYTQPNVAAALPGLQTLPTAALNISAPSNGQLVGRAMLKARPHWAVGVTTAGVIAGGASSAGTGEAAGAPAWAGDILEWKRQKLLFPMAATWQGTPRTVTASHQRRSSSGTRVRAAVGVRGVGEWKWQNLLSASADSWQGVPRAVSASHHRISIPASGPSPVWVSARAQWPPSSGSGSTWSPPGQ